MPLLAALPSQAGEQTASTLISVVEPYELRNIWITYSWDPCPHDWHLNATIWPPGTHWVSMVNKNMKKKTDVPDEPRWRFEGISKPDGYAHLVDTYYHDYYVGFVGMKKVTQEGYYVLWKPGKKGKTNTIDLYLGNNGEKHYHGHFHYESCNWVLDGPMKEVSKEDEGKLDEHDTD